MRTLYLAPSDVRIFYRPSTSCSIPADDTAGICEAARERNGLRDITGVLLCGRPGGGFVRWLEGERETVLGLFAHIRADPRHTALAVIVSEDALLGVTVGQRRFGDWEMRIHDVATLPATGFLRVAAAVPPAERLG